jgi:hypothetical protein
MGKEGGVQQEQAVSCCENCNEPLRYIQVKYGTFLDWTRNYQLLTKGCASQLVMAILAPQTDGKIMRPVNLTNSCNVPEGCAVLLSYRQGVMENITHLLPAADESSDSPGTGL